MENLYNAVVSFKGDNGFTFYLPKYGELTIYNGKDIFIKGLTTSGVEVLRELRPLLLEHRLNGKPDGCYRVIDLTQIGDITAPKKIENQEPVKSVADLKSELIKTQGPIVEEQEPEAQTDIGETEIVEPSAEAPVEEPKQEDIIKPAKTEKPRNKKGGKRSKLGKK